MKKFLALLMVVVMLFALCVACSSGGSSTPAPASSPAASGGSSSGGSSSGGSSAPAAPAGGDKASDEYGEYTPLSDSVKAITIVYADENQEGSAPADGILFFKKVLEERSGGKIVIEPHFNLTLGTSNGDIYQSVCAGDIDMSTGTPGAAVHGSTTAIMDVPAVFADEDLLWKCLQEGEFHDAFCDYTYSEGATSLYFGLKGYRVMTSNKEIRTLDDLKGLDMRLPSNPTWIAVWGSLGVNPTSIPMNEVYLSLQQGVCQAEENSYEQIANNNLLEVQKYCIVTNHVHDAFGLYINNDFYADMDPEVRTLFDETIPVVAKWWDENCRAYNEANRQRCEEQAAKFGSTFIEPDASFMEGMVNATADIVHDARAYSPTADNLCTLALRMMGQDENLGK